jgi:hypothetical protein
MALGTQLGLETIAEGIETTHQLNQLRQLGYRLGQGYLFSPALDVAQAIARLARQSNAGPNSQRKAIYKERTDILRSEEVGEWSKSYIRKEWPGGLLGIKRGMRNRSEVEISYDVKKMQMESVQAGLMNELERLLLLQQIDKSWSKHLKEMSLLREFIAWRGYAQRDPLVEYKNESYNLFIKMIEEIRQGYAYSLFRSQA